MGITMNFIFLTLFPELIQDNAQYSILGKAVDKGLLSIHTINPRDFTTDSHNTVDDILFGGGSGMLLKPEPWIQAIEAAKHSFDQAKVVALVPEGRLLSNELAKELAGNGQDVIFLCGHYEGFDARIYNYVDACISIGEYILTGGELPALIVLDACMRFVPGVLGSYDSAEQDSFGDGLLEGSHYTRPVEYRGLVVPEVLRGGNHKLIDVWRRKQSLSKTKRLRPELLLRANLQAGDGKLLLEIIDEELGEKDG